VGPRIAVNVARVRRLVRATAALIGRHTGAPIEPAALQLAVAPERLRVYHDAYGGAYGRPLAAGDRAAAIFLRRGLTLDATYSAKAGAAALAVAAREPGPTLFWLTFDGRGLEGSDARAASSDR
jgi:D-cysteine desulfhydrase